MAQPTAYDRDFDFTPLAPANVPEAGTRLNAELDALDVALDETQANLALIQRDDGALANQSVHPEALTPSVLALASGSWPFRGAWVTATAYAVSDVVIQSGVGYVCAVAHTAGTFATDLANGNWLQFFTTAVTPAGIGALALAGGTMTGAIVLAALPSADLHPATRSYADALAALRRNRLVNPAMTISQQYGTGNVDCTTGSNYGPDQWIAALSSSPGGTLRIAQVASTTPRGSPNRLRATVQVTDTSLASGDRYGLVQPVEAAQMADARFGSASAKSLLLRLGVRAPAGTYTAFVLNNATDRAWCGTFTISGGEAGTDVERTFTIAGDTTGTWPTDTASAVYVGVTLAAGSTFTGSAGWQAGDKRAISGQSNFMGTVSQVFELFDVGLYVDVPGTGVMPPWEMPEFDDELRRCMRFWQKTYDYATAVGTATTNGALYGLASASANFRVTWCLPVPLRAASGATTYSPVTGASGNYRDDSAVADKASTQITISQKFIVIGESVAPNADAQVRMHAVASARF